MASLSSPENWPWAQNGSLRSAAILAGYSFKRGLIWASLIRNAASLFHCPKLYRHSYTRRRAVDMSGPAPNPRVGLSFPHAKCCFLLSETRPLEQTQRNTCPRPLGISNSPYCKILDAILPSKYMRDVMEHVRRAFSLLLSLLIRSLFLWSKARFVIVRK